MNIGIIGTGRMGGTLAKRWTQKGHRVFLGSRDPQKAQEEAAGVGAQGVSVEEAARQGEIVVLAVPWLAAIETVRALPLGGKILIDITNPIAPGMELAIGHTISAAEEIAQVVPGAAVIKALNNLHYAALEDPHYSGEVPTAFYCGDDEAAKQKVHGLLLDLGVDAEDVGPLAYARYLEPLAMLWIKMAFEQKRGDSFNFRMIRR